MEKYLYPKDARDIAVYSYDFSGLLDDEVEIVALTVSVSCDDEEEPTLTTADEPFWLAQVASARLSGGTAGKTYRVEWEIETATDRFNRTSQLKVRDL